MDRLSPRQRECLALAAGGKTNREIAAALGIGTWTVKEYLSKAYRALGVKSRHAALLRLAREEATDGGAE